MTSRSLRNVLVTGGAGFIGSNFIRYLASLPDFRGRVINVDALTYAGNPASLATVPEPPRYTFIHADIRDGDRMSAIFAEHEIDTVVHLAAESHVDRSIVAPSDFVTTNVMGTFRLLEAARAAWGRRTDVLFHHVSTDEVFGSLGDTGAFSETTPYAPRSPYSASKASSDHLVRAYAHTYGLPATISNCSNNFGPYQFPEKLVPLLILNLLEGRPLPVYGDGGQVRDWLYVDDHAAALWTILRDGAAGETYNVGGGNEWRNLDLVGRLCDLVAEEADLDPKRCRDLIVHVGDRPGHDRRYAIDAAKIRRELGWAPTHAFDDALRRTVRWYRDHPEWVDGVRTGSYRDWMARNYDERP